MNSNYRHFFLIFKSILFLNFLYYVKIIFFMIQRIFFCCFFFSKSKIIKNIITRLCLDCLVRNYVENLNEFRAGPWEKSHFHSYYLWIAWRISYLIVCGMEILQIVDVTKNYNVRFSLLKTFLIQNNFRRKRKATYFSLFFLR